MHILKHADKNKHLYHPTRSHLIYEYYLNVLRAIIMAAKLLIRAAAQNITMQQLPNLNTIIYPNML